MKLHPLGLGLAVLSGVAAAPFFAACSSSPSSTAGSDGGGRDGTSTGSSGGSGGGSSGGSSSGGGSGGSGSGSGSSGGSSGGSTSSSGSSSGGSDGGNTSLHVSGGVIVDGQGNTVQFHGADETGSQTNCAYQAGGSAGDGYPGFFDMPNTQAGVNQMLAWKINAVRVPLNEDCWLGINGLPYGGSTSSDYQSAIAQFVSLLTTNGLSVILDLHWAGPGADQTNPSLGQIPMADADHAVTFWSSVASEFKSNGSVIFDLYNEPNITDWGCWVSGAAASASCAQASGSAYAVAGMATMLQAVRNAGATNIAILGGLAYAQDFSKWVASVQSIPTLPAPLDGISIDNVAASWHAYDFNSAYTQCPSQYNQPPYSAQSCATAQQFATSSGITGVLSAGFPVVIGEMGISAFSTSTASNFSSAQLSVLQGWLDGLMTYMEGQKQGYLAWSWDLDQNPVLITDFSTGAPTPYFGATYQKHLQSTF
jgi:Cellulase (glycosyl hydrolase family 5)